MVESLILLLIYVCIVVAACWLVIWVLGQIGVPLPPQVIRIFWVIVGLICLLLLWHMIGPLLSAGRLPVVR